MKTNYLLYFIISILNIFSDGAPQGSSSQFDHFWLVQTWPRSFCLENPCQQSQPNHFVLHGLWAVDVNGKTIERNPSKRSFIKNIDSTLEKDLLTYWPDLKGKDPKEAVSLWEYQWERHAKMQNVLLLPDYLRRVVQLVKDTDLLNTFKRDGIKDDGTAYPIKSYITAIENRIQGNPKYPIFKCYKETILKEVIICVDNTATNFIPCNKRQERRAGTGAAVRFNISSISLGSSR